MHKGRPTQKQGTQGTNKESQAGRTEARHKGEIRQMDRKEEIR